MSYTINGTIRLVAPIIFNKPSAADIEAVDLGSSGRRKSIKQKEAEALDKLHHTATGAICIPQHNFKKCLIGGAYSAGLKERNRALGPYLDATVFVESELSFDTDTPDEIFMHWGRIPPGPKGKLANLRRPMMKAERVLPFTLSVFDDSRDPAQIHRALVQAGLYVGLGAWRPNYGRFVVEAWDIKKKP